MLSTSIFQSDFPLDLRDCHPWLAVAGDTFRALQIDSECGGIETSGKRINDLSAPLAKAGISIFYLSTYLTDFIFVKEKRIPLVISTLQRCGYTFNDLEGVFESMHQPQGGPLVANMDKSTWVSFVSEASEQSCGTGATAQHPHQASMKYAPPSVAWAMGAQQRSAQDIDPETPISVSVSPPKANGAELIADARGLDKKLLDSKALRLVGLSGGERREWGLELLRVLFFDEEKGEGGRFFSAGMMPEGIQSLGLAPEVLLACIDDGVQQVTTESSVGNDGGACNDRMETGAVREVIQSEEPIENGHTNLTSNETLRSSNSSRSDLVNGSSSESTKSDEQRHSMPQNLMSASNETLTDSTSAASLHPPSTTHSANAGDEDIDMELEGDTDSEEAGHPEFGVQREEGELEEDAAEAEKSSQNDQDAQDDDEASFTGPSSTKQNRSEVHAFHTTLEKYQAELKLQKLRDRVARSLNKGNKRDLPAVKCLSVEELTERIYQDLHQFVSECIHIRGNNNQTKLKNLVGAMKNIVRCRREELPFPPDIKKVPNLRTRFITFATSLRDTAFRFICQEVEKGEDPIKARNTVLQAIGLLRQRVAKADFLQQQLPTAPATALPNNQNRTQSQQPSSVNSHTNAKVSINPPTLPAQSGSLSLPSLHVEKHPRSLGNTGRFLRSSASDLNMKSWPPESRIPTKKFIPVEPTSWIIDISDDEDDQQPDPAPSNHSAASKLEKVKSLEEEMKKLAEMIEMKQKMLKAKLKESSSKNVTPANSALGSSNDLFAPDAVDSLSAKENSTPPLNSSISSTGSPKLDAQPIAVSPKRPVKLYVAPPPISRNETQLLKLSDQRKKIEEEIASDEALLSSALKDITAKESSIAELAESVKAAESKIQESQSVLDLLKKQMEEWQKLMDEENQVLRGHTQTRQDLANSISSLKKAILTKGTIAADLRGLINKRRMQLVDLAKQQAIISSLIKKSTKRPTSDGEEPESHAAKKAKSDILISEGKPSDDDFIQFSNLEVSTKDQNAEGLDILHEASRIKSDVNKPITTQRFIELQSLFLLPSDLLLASDIYQSGLPFNGYWSGSKHQSKDSIQYHKVPTTSSTFKPFETPLKSLRAYRFSKEFKNTTSSGIRSTTYTNKIDPMKKMCMFELQGGSCNDPSCNSQHFKDIKMTDTEIMIDVMSSFDSDKIPELKATLQSMRAQGSSPDEIHNLIVQNEIMTPSLLVKYGIGKKRLVKTAAGLGSGIATPGKNLGETVSGKRWFAAELSKLPSPRNPILLQGLQKLVSGEEVKSGRYYEASFSDEEYEIILKKDVSNVTVWINYAADNLPEDLTMDTLNKPSNNLNKSLNILSKALEKNRSSEELWNFFLELYVRRGSDTDVREVFEEAIGFLPRKNDIKSLALLSAIMLLVRHAADNGTITDASDRLRTFLTATDLSELKPGSHNPPSSDIPDLTITVAFNYLSQSHLAFAWLVVDGKLFAIVWRQLDVENEDLVSKTESVLKSICANWKEFATVEESRAYLAIVRNYTNFSKNIRQNELEVSNSLQAAFKAFPSVPELELLHVDSLFSAESLAIKSPSFAKWNYSAKECIGAGSCSKVAQALVNCIRSCYEGFDMIHDIDAVPSTIDSAIDLYRRALGLASYVDGPELKAEFRSISKHSDVFLWMNFICLQTLKFENVDSGSMLHTFESALESIKELEGRILLWQQFLWMQGTPPLKASNASHDRSRQILKTFGLALDDVHKIMRNDRVDSSEVDFMKGVPDKGHYYTSRLLDVATLLLSEESLTELANILCQVDVGCVAYYPRLLYWEILTDKSRKVSKDFKSLLDLAERFLHEGSVLLVK
ncbi:Zinc finger C3H1 domain-containing protein, partial [Chytridiales sp. JEL 0842]